MKKVLILCHDFPPLQSVGAQRPYSWLKYFPANGIHPVVIARQWPEHLKELRDKFVLNGLKNERIETEEHTCIKVVPKYNLRNELIANHGFKRRKFLRKILTFRDIIFSPWVSKYDSLDPLYLMARDYLTRNRVIAIIATGEPFVLFKYANALSASFNIPWIADYRDPWINNHTIRKVGLISKLIRSYHRLIQSRWTANAAHFTTVSEPLHTMISAEINKPGTVVRNGFDPQLIPDSIETDDSIFELLFVGTVYDAGYLEILFGGLRKFLKEVRPDKGVFKLSFLGIDLNQTAGTARIYRLREELSDFVEILVPLPHAEVLQREARATALLNLVPGSVAGGVTPVSLYEYLALQKPIINIETEISEASHPFLEYMINCHSALEFADAVRKLFEHWRNKTVDWKTADPGVLKPYTREYQAKIMARVVEQISAT